VANLVGHSPVDLLGVPLIDTKNCLPKKLLSTLLCHFLC
jgi:hypothetical protein